MTDGQRAYNAGGDPATANLNLPENVRAKWEAAAAALTGVHP